MRIAFHFLDSRDKSFKKVYFVKWNNDRNPVFTNVKKFAKDYWSEKLANEDIEKTK